LPEGTWLVAVSLCESITSCTGKPLVGKDDTLLYPGEEKQEELNQMKINWGVAPFTVTGRHI